MSKTNYLSLVTSNGARVFKPAKKLSARLIERFSIEIPSAYADRTEIIPKPEFKDAYVEMFAYRTVDGKSFVEVKVSTDPEAGAGKEISYSLECVGQHKLRIHLRRG